MSWVFEWDFRKAKANLRKHKVSFDEACTVFDDPLAVIFPDEDHSNGEEREIIIGPFVPGAAIACEFHRACHRTRSNCQRPSDDTERAERL